MAVALKRQRRDLKKRSEYIEKILVNVTTGVVSLDPDGFVTTANPSALDLLDATVETLKRGRFTEFLKGDERFVALGERLETFLGRDLLREVKDFSVKREREEQQLKTVFTRLLDEREVPAGTLILIEDVSDVVRSNRLAAWAEMARIIAHEVKNPLTPIQLAIEHLVRVHEDGSSDFDRIFRNCSETIMKQVRNLRQISREFSSYARLPKPEFQTRRAVQFLEEVLEPYRFSISQDIDIRLSFPDKDPGRVRIDPELMKRAFTNVVENALQAMPDGGILEAEVREEMKEGRIHALFTIRDNGHGIDEETYRHLFDPYFSTKKSGVGLGLAIVKRTVEEHGGVIQIESEKGGGTAVFIYLPISM